MIKKTLLLVVVFSLLHLTAYASKKLYFPHVECRGEWETELCVINTSECGQLKGIFRPFNDEGKAVSETLQITLEPRGRRQLSVGSDFTNPDSIRYVVFEAESSNLTGYVKFYINRKYRVAVPAVKEINTGDIYVPHIASDASKWWTGLSLVNTNGFSVTLTITFNTEEEHEITMAAGEHKAFTVAQLFDGTPRPDINSAVITKASGIVGLELFGSAGDGNQLSGILLKDDKTQTIYYPHIASDAIWWTGIVVYNATDIVNHITITPYTEDGTELPKKEFEIPPNGKYIGTVAQLALPTGTAWFKVEGDSHITGFELFGTSDKNQMAGYTSVGISARDGVFGKIDKEGWTGIALVNIEDTDASVNLVAYNNAGAVVATKVISVESCAKVVDLAENLFTQDIKGATYIAYASDKEIVGFQLNGSSDGMILDGLPALSADYVAVLAQATYKSVLAMVEPSTGLPHDRFDSTIFDVFPQFAVVRKYPETATSENSSLETSFCGSEHCRHSGNYGLEFEYKVAPGGWVSYSIESTGFSDYSGFDVSQAHSLDLWVKGATGNESFGIVLWDDEEWPGRPISADKIKVETSWKKISIPLTDFETLDVDLTSLWRLVIDVNDAMSKEGTIYLDDIAFVDVNGNRIHVALDESTNVSNIGLYMADILGAVKLGIEEYDSALSRLNTTLTSVENLINGSSGKTYGFPHTHNHVASLQPLKTNNVDDRCLNRDSLLPGQENIVEPNLFSTVDLGNLYAGLILLKHGFPELSERVDRILNNTDWSWLFSHACNLPYGCRSWDGVPSDWWCYGWLAADSRLAHFIGIGSGGMPQDSWTELNREEEPQICADTWHYEPGWDGGGLFMQLLPGIFIDESGTTTEESARNFIADQICKASEIEAPAFGLSAAALPPDGKDYWGYGQSPLFNIIVPHALVLSAEYLDQSELIKYLHALDERGARPRASDGIHKYDFGFIDSIDWQLGDICPVYLSLDQSMLFLSLVNLKTKGYIRQVFFQNEIVQNAAELTRDPLEDIVPQFADVLKVNNLEVQTSETGNLEQEYCFSADDGRHSGYYGLKFIYDMPPGQWGSFNLEPGNFNAGQATYLQVYVKGAKGGEKFGIVLWHNDIWPGRPPEAEILASSSWQRIRIPLSAYEGMGVDLSTLWRVSIDFNDAISSKGEVYVDDIAFVNEDGNIVRTLFQ